MQRSKCLSGVASALHRVFVQPTEQLQQCRLVQIASKKPSPMTYAPQLSLQQVRCYAAPSKALPQGSEITTPIIKLVNEEGRLSSPMRTPEILDSLDSNTHILVMVSMGNPQDPESYPVCKVLDKKKMREASRAKAKQTKNPATTVKTLELNWAIDGNDLAHRLNKMKQFLEKGYKVEVIMAGKRKGRRATSEEAESVITKIREAIADVKGAKESKPFEGAILGQAKLFADGKAL